MVDEYKALLKLLATKAEMTAFPKKQVKRLAETTKKIRKEN